MKRIVISIVFFGITVCANSQPSKNVEDASFYMKDTIILELEGSFVAEGMGNIAQNEVWSMVFKLNKSDSAVRRDLNNFINKTDKVHLSSGWEEGWNGDASVCTVLLGDEDDAIEDEILVFVAFEKLKKELHLALKEKSDLK